MSTTVHGDIDRLRSAMPVVVDALRTVAQDLRLTDEELRRALMFIGEVAAADELVLLSDVLGVSRLVDDQTHGAASSTPSAVLGPFYRPDAPWIGNPGSIVRDDTAPGVSLTGTVVDATSLRSIAGAVVDIWHADARGTYSNEDESMPAWHLRGRQRSDDIGRYVVATVVPRHYTVKHDGPVGSLLAALGRHPWRPAHIHLLVEADGYEPLVTQVYIADSPYLDDDAIDDVKDGLIRPIEDGTITFDIRLQPRSTAVR